MVFSSKYILLTILILAFMLRIVGVGYGLPLWLIDDEPAFTLASLKMIQLKTLLPRAYFEEFKSVLYYPPHLSYFYLPFFGAYLAIKLLLFDGSREMFMNYLGSDPSGFFIIVRILHVFLAVLSVWLVYRITQNIFKNNSILGSGTSAGRTTSGDIGPPVKAGLVAAFFLATSILHISLSPNGRHWLPVSFILALGLFFLTRESWSYKKRYFLTALLAGLGMGVSVMSGFLALFMLLHYLFMERRGIAALLRDWFSYAILATFGFLAWLPKWLYPGSYGFGVDVTSGETKTLIGALTAPFIFLKPILISEPIFAILAVLGLIFSFRQLRGWFWASILFIIFYGLAFYQFFRFEHRFVLGIFPLLAILAGYGLSVIYKNINRQALKYGLLVVIAVFQLAGAGRLGYLMYRGDSRSLAREWAEENIPTGAKIVVNARLTRLSTTAEAVKEQESLNADSLRQADRAEAAFVDNPHGYKNFHALNLFTVRNEGFYKNIENYVKENNYEYLFLSLADFQKNPALLERLKRLASSGIRLAQFGSDESIFSYTAGYFNANPLELFRISEFGPPIGIYELK